MREGGGEDEPDVAGLQRGKSKTGEAFSAGTWMAVNDFMETRLMGLSD